MPEPTKRSHPLAGALWSLLAIGFTLLFVFPLYWAVSTALRNPADTFTVAGIGFPWLDFQPTLDNFRTELSTPEGLRALRTSIIVSVTAVFAALRIVQARPELRTRLWANVNTLFDGLKRQGFKLGAQKGPVVAVHLPSPEIAVQTWHALLESGVYVNLALPPATPNGTALLRCSVCAAHTRQQLESIIEILTEIAYDNGLLAPLPRVAVA